MSAQPTPVRAGDVRVSEVDDIRDLAAMEALFARIWGSGKLPIARDLMRALRVNGNYVAGAFAAGELVGGVVGFLGVENGSGLHLHSHILGVRADVQVRGVGQALKQHQRSWATSRGIAIVTWTFDPLVRRNAYFNIAKLGAGVADYLPNFYDSMGDRINGDGESDRLLARWDLSAETSAMPPRIEDLAAAGATYALREVDGLPVMRPLAGEILLVEVPEDIVRVRLTNLPLAAAWREAVRTTLGEALRRGWKITAMSRSGFYVLRRTVAEVL